MISCRDLWYTAPQDCTFPPGWDAEDLALRCPHNITGGWASPMWRGSLRPDGRLIVTDAVLAIYTTELTGCPEMPAPMRMSPNAVRRVAAPMLAARVVEEPSRRWFQARYLDVLEPAGYLVRPLHGQVHMHAVLGLDGIVGVLMPKAPGAPDPSDRQVAV